MNTHDINQIEARLRAKQNAKDVPDKYRDAFRTGLDDATTILKHYAHEPPDQVVAALRRRLNTNPYLSSNKTEAYHKAIRVAMSLLHELKGKG